MKLKISFLHSFLKKRNTMQKKLFGYMLILTTALLCLLASFLFFLGRFEGTAEKTFNTLSLQTEVFDREISAYYDSIIAKCINLSKNTTTFTEKYLKKNNITFDGFKDSIHHIENIESEYMDLLTKELLRTDCSGAFIMLDTTRTSKDENSKAGVYIQKDLLGSDKQDAMLLYRGTAALGKAKGIMPHRKWNLEFKRDGFPNYDQIFYSKQQNIQDSCHITDVITLPGMSERIMLVAIPIRSQDGTPLGICGFEISESLFKTAHAQPTTLEHLTCVFSRKSSDSKATINSDEGFACGIENGYYLQVKGSLEVQNIGYGLKQYKNDHHSYIGITTNMPLCIENSGYEITVMIPKDDYTKKQTLEVLQFLLIIALLLFSSVLLCMYFSKLYITPILKGLNNLKQTETDNTKSNIAEIDELFDYLAEKSKSYQQSIKDLDTENKKAKNTIEIISNAERQQVSPEDYEYFIKGIKTLTPAERNIFNMYLSGKTIKQIAEENNIKEATVKFHNHNIYDKLGVTNKKELLRFAALYLQEKD